MVQYNMVDVEAVKIVGFNSLWPSDAIYGDRDQGQHWHR